MSKWDVLSSREVLKLSHFGLRLDAVRTGRGHVIDDYPIVETRDWVCVVCIDEAGEAVFVQQYRHGSQEITLEFVAGGIDPGEEPEQAARRELLEETGYEAAHWELLRTLRPDSTRHRNRAHIWLATGARRVAEQELEPSEDLVVTLRSLEDPRVWDELTHAVHLLAFVLARKRLAIP